MNKSSSLLPAKGGGVEAAATEDVTSILTGYCSTAFDGSSASDILQNSSHRNYSGS
jgi:hypothetical protein